MKQFIQTLPSECEQAARLDGASEWQVYTRIRVQELHSVITRRPGP